MMLDLYESQVAAFYDPKTGAMTIVKRDGTFGPEERVFVAHEYDHALAGPVLGPAEGHTGRRHPGRPGARAPGARRGRRHEPDAPVGVTEPDCRRAVAGLVAR